MKSFACVSMKRRLCVGAIALIWVATSGGGALWSDLVFGPCLVSQACAADGKKAKGSPKEPYDRERQKIEQIINKLPPEQQEKIRKAHAEKYGIETFFPDQDKKVEPITAEMLRSGTTTRRVTIDYIPGQIFEPKQKSSEHAPHHPSNEKQKDPCLWLTREECDQLKRLLKANALERK